MIEPPFRRGMWFAAIYAAGSALGYLLGIGIRHPSSPDFAVGAAGEGFGLALAFLFWGWLAKPQKVARPQGGGNG